MTFTRTPEEEHHDKICQWCGKYFMSKRQTRLTCSQPCRQARARHWNKAVDVQMRRNNS